MSRELMLAVFIIGVSFPLVSQNVADSMRRKTPIRFFENFIGTYEAPDSVRARHPGIGERSRVTLEFDRQQRSVHFVEAHAPDDKTDRVLEGFAFWNPHTGGIEFYSYNSEEDFLFKGKYTIATTDTLQRIYDVFYPPGHRYYEMGHAVLTFRETTTLSDDLQNLHNKVEYFDKRNRKWLHWSTSALHRVR